MIDIGIIIKRIEYLPPFPVTVARALQMLEDPKVTPESIAEFIRFDQGIATNVLKLCNSSYFGLKRSITSLQEALVYIGLSRFREILVLSGTRQYFEKKIPGYELQKGELWGYSLASAIIAENLCDIIVVENKEEAFLAALLHDLGKLVLSEYVTESFNEIREKVTNERNTFIEAERATIGCDHAELGARILEMWGFAQSIIDAVRKHHDPTVDSDSRLEDIVRLADTVCLMMGYGTSVDGLAYRGFDDVCRKYQILQETLDSVMADSLEKIKKVEQEYGITREEI
jgi:putative nucleotidyltransferase with HDIG domain